MKKYKVMHPNVYIEGKPVKVGEMVELSEATARLFPNALSEVKRKPTTRKQKDS